ncbi:hypothetical protein ASF11_11975 [Acidovorax sp. Leaf76]|nr:hypothetical protein ASF11_11975 [Acidovorax sp. Leaf76]KQO20716.1 hypothetical protein ASF16_25085 [Acidovorax sp. Leaf78]KQO37050.1 hypothetical protein ASF19_20755 [Acidovorax sp. Leaf84]KQS29276.1 hypothetical protein ASG27_13810 [Acidovorax sp. Leaf191]
MMYIPLSGCAASPFSRTAARCGKGDAALAAGRPLHGGHWPGQRRFYRATDLANTLEMRL